MSVFDLSEIQAQYILDTPLRRLTRYDRLELDRERETLQREIDELTAILESETRLRELVSRRAGRGRRAVRQPAAHRAAGRQREGPHRGGAARGGRRPVPGAAVVRRAHRPDRDPARRRPGRGHAGRGRPGRRPGGRRWPAHGPRRDHRHRGHYRAREHGRGHLARPADPDWRAGDPGPAAERPLPVAGGRRADRRVRRPGGGRDRGRAGRAGRLTGRAGPRHRGRCGQAGRAGLPGQRHRVRGHLAEGRRPGGRRGPAGWGGCGPGVHHQRRPAAPVPRLSGPPPGPRGGRDGRDPALVRCGGDLVRRGAGRCGRKHQGARPRMRRWW